MVRVQVPSIEIGDIDVWEKRWSAEVVEVIPYEISNSSGADTPRGQLKGSNFLKRARTTLNCEQCWTGGRDDFLRRVAFLPNGLGFSCEPRRLRGRSSPDCITLRLRVAVVRPLQVLVMWIFEKADRGTRRIRLIGSSSQLLKIPHVPRSRRVPRYMY